MPQPAGRGAGWAESAQAAALASGATRRGAACTGLRRDRLLQLICEPASLVHFADDRSWARAVMGAENAARGTCLDHPWLVRINVTVQPTMFRELPLWPEPLVPLAPPPLSPRAVSWAGPWSCAGTVMTGRYDGRFPKDAEIMVLRHEVAACSRRNLQQLSGVHGSGGEVSPGRRGVVT
jgi:hypothetical protein